MLFVGKKAQKGPLESLLPHFLSIAHFHAKQKRIFRAGRKRPCEKIFVFWIDRADALPGVRGVREPSDSGRREGFRAVPESPRRDVRRAWGRPEEGLVRGGDYENAPDEGEEGGTCCPSRPLAGRPFAVRSCATQGSSLASACGKAPSANAGKALFHTGASPGGKPLPRGEKSPFLRLHDLGFH